MNEQNNNIHIVYIILFIISINNNQCIVCVLFF